jgi:hypothetical protein
LVGIEDPDDLVGELRQALDAATLPAPDLADETLEALFALYLISGGRST